MTPQEDFAPEALRSCLLEALGGESIRVLSQESLKTDVHRVRVDVDGRERSLVVKRSDSAAARRNWLVSRRWLPAAGLVELGPPVLALHAESGGEATWLVCEDAGGHTLSTDPVTAGDVEAAIDALARIHTAFADHPLLAECRLWGGDRGIHFYSTNLRDAVIALRSLDLDGCGAEALHSREALLTRLHELQGQEADRAHAITAVGAPETLLHGDLWPSNAIVVENGAGVGVRLVDWDEAAAGPAWFDMSTLLLRFDPSQRRWVLNLYEKAVDRIAGWRSPPEPELNLAMETAAYSRLASLLVWSVAAAGESRPEWLFERLAAMPEWLDAVEPVLPPAS